MKQVSRWANNNIVLARILLICSKILLSFLGIYSGILLAGLQIKIPSLFIFGIVVIAVCAITRYPRKNLKENIPGSYGRRKACDMVLALCGFLCVVTIANHLDTTTTSTNAAFAISHSNITPAEKIIASLKYRDKSTLTKNEKKVLRREFYSQVKIYAKATLQQDDDKKDHSLAIILTIIAAAGLLYLIASLACSLSCAGNDVAALLVVLLGTAGLVWGTIALIKRIKRGPPAPKTPTPAE